MKNGAIRPGRFAGANCLNLKRMMKSMMCDAFFRKEETNDGTAEYVGSKNTMQIFYNE